ncbi:hypothetical protein QYF36_019479 [Acer negundo]|nr:hypothetical protein QYF36_019479 [Acer negundo]
MDDVFRQISQPVLTCSDTSDGFADMFLHMSNFCDHRDFLSEPESLSRSNEKLLRRRSVYDLLQRKKDEAEKV